MAILRTQQLVGRFTAVAAVNQAMLTSGVFAALQVMRLVVNVLLAHLLAPAIFGVMALVNSLRSGVELLTDVGVGQNIIVNKQGGEPAFYSTAWTIQVLRGALLTLIAVALAWPIAYLYKKPDLFPILLVCSLIFLLTGVNSPARFLMQRASDIKGLSKMDIFNQVSGAAISIGFAYAMPSVWGMTWALVVSSAMVAAISYLFMRKAPLAITLDREHARTILTFGKWIFVSSLIYFAATNFDRLYLPTHIPLAMFGVYGISRSMSDLASMFMQRIGGNVVLPSVARAGDTLGERLGRIAKLRFFGLAIVSVGLGAGVAISDIFVTLAYDARYEAAAVILPILLLGAWFAIQAAISENVLLGLSQPNYAAAANFAKLLWTVTLLPLTFAYGTLLQAFVVIAAADVPRYLTLAWAQRRAGLSFLRQDVVLLSLMLGSAIILRAGLAGVGLASGLVSDLQQGHLHQLIVPSAVPPSSIHH